MKLFKKKNKYEFVRWGILAGVLECIYVFLAVLILTVINSKTQQVENIFAGGLFMLLFLVFSVAVSAILVFGRPVQLVLKKKPADALPTFFVTLVTIFIIFVIVSIIIFI